MILRSEIPKDIQDKFLELFKAPLETYWDPFWGWLQSDNHKQFLNDFPHLTPEQDRLINELVKLEQEQLEETAKIADLELTANNSGSYMRKNLDHYRR